MDGDAELGAWRGRVALVTGASSGIGRAVASRLARGGMHVAGCARRYDRMKTLAEELADAPGAFLPLRADLRRPEDVEALFEQLRAEWDGVDVLVNNAGLARKASLLTGDADAWREILDVNVLALSVCTREAVADMRRRGDDGHVFHVSSLSAHRVPAGSAMYAASKHAVKALTEALRLELHAEGSGVRVTSISPGFVETEFAVVASEGDPDAHRRVYGQYPVLQPDDVADHLVHALTRPSHVQIHDLLVRPRQQPT